MFKVKVNDSVSKRGSKGTLFSAKSRETTGKDKHRFENVDIFLCKASVMGGSELSGMCRMNSMMVVWVVNLW